MRSLNTGIRCILLLMTVIALLGGHFSKGLIRSIATHGRLAQSHRVKPTKWIDLLELEVPDISTATSLMVLILTRKGS